MAIVEEMLRHSSIAITVDTYGHLSEDTARTASDAMAAALEQAFETTAAAAGNHIATTAAAGAAHPGRPDRRTCWSARWAPWGSNPQPAD